MAHHLSETRPPLSISRNAVARDFSSLLPVAVFAASFAFAVALVCGVIS